MTILRFRKIVWQYAKKHGRHALPWRTTRKGAYHVLVSEIMLQQTQVERVVPFYGAFLKQFPSVRVLARAPLADVLTAWQGLGYNRRAKMLHDAAKSIVREHDGRMPRDIVELEQLPGIGPYTARAIAAFAYNQNTVFVETNVRTAVIYHFFPECEKVADAEIMAVLERALPLGSSREWYTALMDYGSHLKRSGIRTNARSATYVKQKRFVGSEREARGALVKALASGPKRTRVLAQLLGSERKAQLMRALEELHVEGMVARQRDLYALPDGYPVSRARSPGRTKE